ncbi:MAG TPA: hypothetical protein VGC49_11250 [Solirubrobacterales bacterium]
MSRLTYTLRGPEWGFAVPQGNLAALEEVIRLCSSFWNGLGSLIIPVRSDGTLDQSLDRLLEVREVDQMLVHDAIGECAREALGKRFREVGSLWMDDHEIHPYYLSLNDRDESLASIQRPVFGSRRLRRVAEATWGHIADDEVEDWRRRFEVTEETRRTEALRGILEAQIRGNSPLLLGARHMGAYEQRAGFDGYPCLFVFGRAGFEEIVHFWNLRSRLSGFHDSRPIVGIPREMLSATELEPIRVWVEEPKGATYYKPDISLAVEPAERPAVLAALEELGFVSAGERTRYRHGFPEPPDGRTALEFFELGTGQLGGPMRRGANATTLATVTDGRAALDVPSPEGVRLPYGYLRFSIDGLPLPLPLTTAAARRMIPNAWVSQEGLTIKTHTERRWRFDIELPDAEQALIDWASSYGYEVRPSQPGRYAQALVGRLATPADLDALADPIAAEILDQLTPDSTKRLAQRLKTDVEIEAEALDEQVLLELLQGQGLLLRVAAKTLNELASNLGRRAPELTAALAGLIEVGLVRRGISFACPRCNFDQVVSLGELDERIECQACREELVTPVLSGNKEHPTAYFLDGLTARLMEESLLSVLLALRRARLDGGARESFIAWPGLLFTKSGATVDGDLLVTDGSTVNVFECKMNASRLELDQTRRLLNLCEELRAKPGIAGLRGEFDNQIKSLVLEAGGIVYEGEKLFDGE